MTRWGIVGTGKIAHKFADAIRMVDDATLIAVASRAKETADKFADEYDATHRHIGAAELAKDPEVDAIYVGTTNPAHKPDTLACLNGGKAVLSEKPFAINAAGAAEMIEAAKSKNLFLMEAMWTAFFPAMFKVRELVTSGAIGEVRQLRASFCFGTEWNPKSRVLDPELGGGALLDVGIYPIAFARMILPQEPTRIESMAHIGKTGIDEQASMLLGYDNGAIATLTCAVQTQADMSAAVYGTEGKIEIPTPFWKPQQIVVQSGDGLEETNDFDTTTNGFEYQIEEVGRCLRDGKTESNIVSHEFTMGNMRTMDKIRKQWGLVYPMESL